MSTLSAQCDELRELAAKYDELKSGATRVVRISLDTGPVLREAADTIDRLDAENAKLREENQSIGLAAYELGRRSMAGENVKLRELVRELWTYAEQELLCDENCPYGAACNWRDCVFERRMRELGVEVDDGQMALAAGIHRPGQRTLVQRSR